MRRAPILAAFVFALCTVFAAPALAAGVYTVAGVKVDVSQPDATQARAAGFAQAHSLAFTRLVSRLTLPADLAAKGAPQLSPTALDALVANVEIVQERPSRGRYAAQLTVSFDPAGARKALQAQGLNVIDTRTAPILVVAQAPGAPQPMADLWLSAWTSGGYGEELVPVAVAPATLTGAPDWTKAAPFAAAGGATRALYANARLAGTMAYVDLVEVNAAGGRRMLGTLNAPLTAGSEATAFQTLADAANAKVQTEWKGGLAAGGGQRERVVASALYSSQSEWARLKRGLEGAAKTVVSGVSIDAVSKDAAMVSFAYVGGRDQLAAELLRNGVLLQDSPQGVVLKLVPGGA